MSNIRKNFNNIFDLRLNRQNNWDFQLAQDNVQCYSCNDIVSGDVITSFEFDNISGMCSSIEWEDAISFNENLCDIGLTGVDNRFVDNFTGETYNPFDSKKFCVKRVSGDTFCYEMNTVAAIIGNNISVGFPQHIQFCGGFFQGFYKLHEYEYEVLPNFYQNGWTKEFWIKQDNCPSGTTITVTGESITLEPSPSGLTEVITQWSLDVITGGTCEFKPQLNSIYPENEGIFYYWGLRAENKFCMFSPLSGLTTCTGIPLAPKFELKEFEPKINSFLYYNRKQMCIGVPNPTVEFTDCCDGLLNNAMAFRITDEGEIGVRILTTSGECIMSDGSIKFSGTPIVEEFYSSENIISNDKWHHVVYRYEPYSTSECIGYRVAFGVLSIFVDGFLKLKMEDFPEFQPYALLEHKDKQLGVPYNISIGGGTQGLLESIPSGDSVFYDTTGYTACDYVTNLIEPCMFGGISINGVEIISPPLNVHEADLIQMWLEMNISRIQGNIIVSGQQFNRRDSLRIELNGMLDIVDYIIYSGGGRLNMCKTRCYDVPPHIGNCGILEENFAGTFIGSIAAFRLHKVPLCFSEIQCNFNQEKEKYNRHRDKPKCDIN